MSPRRMRRKLNRRPGSESATLLEKVRERYATLKTALYEWEYVEKEYRRVRESLSEGSQTYMRSVKQQFEEKRRRFIEIRRSWVRFINTNPLIPRTAHI